MERNINKMSYYDLKLNNFAVAGCVSGQVGPKAFKVAFLDVLYWNFGYGSKVLMVWSKNTIIYPKPQKKHPITKK